MRSDYVFDTYASHVDDGLLIDIWQQRGNCKTADNVMQRIAFPDFADKFLSLWDNREVKCLKCELNDKLDLFQVKQ